MNKKLSLSDLEQITSTTLSDYDSSAQGFWEGTKDHDVTQNYEAFLSAMPNRPGLKILDFGCGPGRDLIYFKNAGHEPVGLDGTSNFCLMAEKNSGCSVMHQNFLSLNLPKRHFDGVFANASMFHVPRQELISVLTQLRESLVDNGVLFMSNPRGNQEGWMGKRYGTFMEFEGWENYLVQSGFRVLKHYFRPKDLPCHQQPWVAIVSQKTSEVK